MKPLAASLCVSSALTLPMLWFLHTAHGGDVAKAQPPGAPDEQADALSDPAFPYGLGLDAVPGEGMEQVAELIRKLARARSSDVEDEDYQFFVDPPYTNGQRWPGNFGDPITLTWSFVPDGTFWLNSPTMGVINSSMFAHMNGLWGAANQWQWIAQIEDGFARWEELTGITFERVTVGGMPWDDGAPYGTDEAPGLRGHIRLFLAPLGDGAATGPGTGNLLAVAEPPQSIFSNPSEGEITFDIEDWKNEPWLQGGFDRAIMHELGHALGLNHSCPSLPSASAHKLMQFGSVTNFYGPQHDDIRGMQDLYGDPFEPNDHKDGATSFNIYPAVIPQTIGQIPPPAVLPWDGGLLSIDPHGDEDWFRFTLLQSMQMKLTLTPIGGLYQEGPELDPMTTTTPTCGTISWVESHKAADLAMHLWRSVDENDFTYVTSASTPGLGIVEIIDEWLPFAGTYFVHVTGPSLGTTQLYELEADFYGSPCVSDMQCDEAAAEGIETCDQQLGTCRHEFIDEDGDFDSTPDSLDVTTNCNSNALWDDYEIAQAKVRGADDCSRAEPILANTLYNYTSVFATPDGPQLSCNLNAEPDVWFRYTPQWSGDVTVSLCGSDVAHIPTVYRADATQPCYSQPVVTLCGSLGPCGLGEQPSTVTFFGDRGVEYLIRVSGRDANPWIDVGEFSLFVYGSEDVTNDCDRNGVIDDCEPFNDLNLNGLKDECELSGLYNWCNTNPNSETPGAVVWAEGTLSVADDYLKLHVSGAPANVNGRFFFGQVEKSSPPQNFSCLASPTKRLPVITTDGNGEAFYELYPSDLPAQWQFAPGDTWNFQFWYRDPAGSTANGTNFSDVLRVKFY